MSGAGDPIFEPLRFRNLTVKNRVFRSNVSGRFDLYDGTGTVRRIIWELKFARGGKAAKTEARRMVAEKGVAFAEATATLATGGSMKKVVRRVRSAHSP